MIKFFWKAIRILVLKYEDRLILSRNLSKVNSVSNFVSNAYSEIAILEISHLATETTVSDMSLSLPQNVSDMSLSLSP